MATSDQTFQEQCAEQTSSAVEKWLSILHLHPQKLGGSFMRMTPGISEDGGSQNNRSSAWGQIEGHFHFKGECISKIINWRELEQGKQDSAEVIQDDVRHYFCWLQDTCDMSLGMKSFNQSAKVEGLQDCRRAVCGQSSTKAGQSFDGGGSSMAASSIGGFGNPQDG